MKDPRSTEASEVQNDENQIDSFERIQADSELKPIQRNTDINPSANKYPYCIVWTQLPLISFFLPIIGHTGICSSDGTIYDFAGSQFISEDDLAFGEPYKYVKFKPCANWDQGILKANSKYWNEDHNLCVNNCHSHVATALENMRYGNKSLYTMFHVWWYCLVYSRYVSWSHLFKNYIGWGFILLMVLVLKMIQS